MDRRKFLRTSVAASVAASTPAWADWEDVLYRPTKVESDIDAIKLDGSEFTLKQAEVHTAHRSGRRQLRGAFRTRQRVADRGQMRRAFGLRKVQL